MKEISLNGKTPDIAKENIKKLRRIFPDVFIEDKVDFEKLQQVLGEYVEDSNERYNFAWNGKGKALRLSQTPSLGTLRPCKEESKDWDTTKNLYIEGDNLEILKLLQKSYHSKVKMIYIDPPYNTGKDFVYKDNFRDSLGNYKKIIGQVDSEGNRMSTNMETSGRYHTNWLNMMYPRLRLARNLLSDDGVIFISIDDNEVDNLKKVCNEVFGEDNFVANIIWEKKASPQNDAKWISDNHDHILTYAKNKNQWTVNDLPRTEEQNKRYKNPDNDPRGRWTSGDLSVKTYAREYDYPIIGPNGVSYTLPPGRCWMTSKERMIELINDNRIWFGKDGNNMPRLKRFLSEVKAGITPKSLWFRSEVGDNQKGKRELLEVMPENVFQTPKPIDLIKRMMYISTKKDSLILDFFSGSATTAHSVMKFNFEDGGNRKFIMVQLPEQTNNDGFKNICEIGKERIRRAGEKIKEDNQDKENIENLDIGFKVFKLDTSNIRKWQPDSDNLEQSLLDYVDHYMEGRTELDIVYEIMLKYGLDLSYPVEEFTISGKKVYSIGFGMLMICLDDEITTDIAHDILDKVKELGPESSRVVFKDNGFKTDSNKTNIKEILKIGGIEEFITL